MYKSPIDILYGQLETQIEGDIMKAVQKVHVNVDKDELLRALQYDRGQYEKGYEDAMASVVRCKDCKHYGDYGRVRDCCKYGGMNLPNDNDFCSYGERKEDG